MPQQRPGPGELIDVAPLGDKLVDTAPIALARTDDFEVMRLVLPKGKTIPQHTVEGELTLQCIEGAVDVQALDRTLTMQAGQMIYLYENTPYALSAREDASLLMTVLRKGNMNG